MATIADVMTERPRAVTQDTTIREAARLMGEEDVGALPIVGDSARLVGIVTDRDILTCPEDELKDVKVLATVVGGKVVYEKK